ncbi:AMP-dependent ligase [Thermocladium modestius]|uniref:AMP-dependent ligase n=1 Tax=Thermocladium modestius TaxID=62609 RepID=A0A830GY19_9CREN|nr:long-chain-fatty-acid--CoA ligase [Thermocladium modestius]GGP22003.1 AMP-dependent ligase [Thermocladium modestius]
MSYYDYQLTIDKILNYIMSSYPNREIVYWPYNGRRTMLTNTQFNHRVRQVASLLLELGAKRGEAGRPGTRVAVLDWNSLRYGELYYAVPSIGATLFTVNVRLAPQEIIYTMNVAKPELLFINIDDFSPLLKPIMGNVNSIKYVIYMSDENKVPDDHVDVKMLNYYDETAKQGEASFPELDERTPATMLFTSGTTGLPKGGIHTHRGLVLHSLATIGAVVQPPIELKNLDTAMPLVPMYHVHAWGMPYSLPLAGVKIVYPGKFEWGHMLRLIAEEKVTFTAGVPTILYALLSHPDSPKYDLRGVKMIIGGAALPKGLLDAAVARGMTVISGYGLTETAPILTISHLRPEHASLDGESRKEVEIRTGLPVPLVDLRVVDQYDNDVPPDGKTIGEIAVRSPWIFKEYMGDEEKTRNAWRNGWFHTGDAAVRLPDGYVKIVDRMKDVVKSGGEWISSLRLEDLISTHPSVAAVAVIGVPHDKWGERPVALVTPKKGQQLREEDIIRHLERYVSEGAIPKWWLPDKVIIVDELPLTSTGKVDKKSLRDRYGNVLKQK